MARKLKPNILFLTLKQPYFNQILSGEKHIEYRKPSKHFKRVFTNKHYTHVIFQNGYLPTSKRMMVEIIDVRLEQVKIPFFDQFNEKELYCIYLANPKILNVGVQSHKTE